jgi:hypothetical protein
MEYQISMVVGYYNQSINAIELYMISMSFFGFVIASSRRGCIICTKFFLKLIGHPVKYSLPLPWNYRIGVYKPFNPICHHHHHTINKQHFIYQKADTMQKYLNNNSKRIIITDAAGTWKILQSTEKSSKMFRIKKISINSYDPFYLNSQIA